jgi:hypothetical protein
MRLKSYYPPEEITTNLFTNGKEWQTDDGVEYRGSYHRYLTKEVYTGAVWNAKTSKRLKPYIAEITRNITYVSLKTRLQTKFIMPWQVTPVITITDRSAGSINRYFIKKINDASILEIDKPQYEAHQNNVIDSNMFSTTKIIWYITGAVNDETVGAVVKQGVRTKNLTQIAYANQAMPGIATLLTDPLQFYTDNDYKVPPSIN